MQDAFGQDRPLTTCRLCPWSVQGLPSPTHQCAPYIPRQCPSVRKDFQYGPELDIAIFQTLFPSFACLFRNCRKSFSKTRLLAGVSVYSSPTVNAAPLPSRL